MTYGKILSELQMITGIISDDAMFLYSKLIEKKDKSTEDTDNEYEQVVEIEEQANTDVDSWFKDL